MPANIDSGVDVLLQNQGDGNINLTVTGGTFNNVQGNSYTNIIYNTHRATRSQTPKRERKRDIRKNRNGVESAVVPPVSTVDISLPEVFPQVQQSLEFIQQLIEPHSHSKGICHGISLQLRELDDLFQFSSLAYQACNSSTVIGKLVRCTIGTRLLQCKDILREVHRDLLRLPHRSLPLTPFICRVVYGWWSGSEPNEVAEIRLRIRAEATAVAEWLCYLKLFYWAGSLLHAKSSFSWKTLNQFFRSGPTWLKEIHVERIIVIEPLQGEALSIPLCFAESFEDVHRIVQSVCEGTLGSRFIEDRQYQLDESITNVTVDPTHFHAFLEDGKAFEVTMLIQTMSLATTDCPRCGCSNSSDVPSEGDDWIRCRGCRTLFNSRVSLLPSHPSQLSGLVEVSSEEGTILMAIVISTRVPRLWTRRNPLLEFTHQSNKRKTIQFSTTEVRVLLKYAFPLAMKEMRAITVLPMQLSIHGLFSGG
ncbi:hypothetical protein BKA70DRAFT_757955 [Coprinopsis sp. MPI-PUGE-AT-0042]|nr:hypothetical protein BKA70DRAFT_757955 [Coprinopsis sp. MPI-PUGE-AT-0042]